MIARTLLLSASAVSGRHLPHPLADSVLQRVMDEFEMPSRINPPLLDGPGRLPGDSERSDSSWAHPDISLTARMTFDRNGNRLGYGAGYYDMTIATLRAKKRVVAVGLAFAAQEVDEVPTTSRDVRLDLVLTERETIDIRG